MKYTILTTTFFLLGLTTLMSLLFLPIEIAQYILLSFIISGIIYLAVIAHDTNLL